MKTTVTLFAVVLWASTCVAQTVDGDYDTNDWDATASGYAYAVATGSPPDEDDQDDPGDDSGGYPYATAGTSSVASGVSSARATTAYAWANQNTKVSIKSRTVCRAAVTTGGAGNDANSEAIVYCDAEIEASESANSPKIKCHVQLSGTGSAAAVYAADGDWVLGGVFVEAVWDSNNDRWDLYEDGVKIYTGTSYNATRQVSISSISSGDWIYGETSINNSVVTPASAAHNTSITIQGRLDAIK